MASRAVAGTSPDQAKDAVPGERAKTSLYCATSPGLAGVTGEYYDNCRRKEPSAVATPQLAQELWDHSISWVDLREEQT